MRAGQLDRHEALRPLAPEHPQIEAREVRAEAEVLADAEAEVRVRVAVDAEGERVLEDVLVAVGRRVEERQRVALADLLAAQLVVARRGAREVVDRRRPAHDLVGRDLDEIAGSPGACGNSSGCSRNASRPPRDRVPRGVVPGDHDQEVEREELERRHRPAVASSRWRGSS